MRAAMSRRAPIAATPLGRIVCAADVGALWIGEVDYPAGARFERHAHSRPYVTLVLRGGFEERFGRDSHEVGSADVVLTPAGREHGERFGAAGARFLVVALPDDSAPSRVTAGVFSGGPVSRAGFALCRVWRSAQPERGLAMEEHLVELLGAARAQADAPLDCAVAERAREVLTARACGQLRLAVVAADLGCSPAHLARSFRRRFGCTMSSWVAQRRAQVAAQRLSGTRQAAAEVALDCGFADQSHMTRVLRRELGVTPRELRRLATG